MKIVFMGTPDFAVAPLEAIIKAGHEVTLCVTQPDRMKGRGKEISMSPVKECALKHGIPVFQPEKIKAPEAVAELKRYEADIFVVAAFGQLLSEEVLYMPKYGSINIHASLLPKLRGAAPIQWSILDGDENTGVTIMQMAKGLDTGDILTQSIVPILDDTGESLFDKLSIEGANLLVKTLPMIENGEITPIVQNEEEATYAKKITKEMGLINWAEDASKIERYVRGLNSWPSAYTTIAGKTLKIWKAQVVDAEGTTPGTIIAVTADTITVATAKGALCISELQLEGKKRMSVHDFLLGYSLKEGMKLG